MCIRILGGSWESAVLVPKPGWGLRLCSDVNTTGPQATLGVARTKSWPKTNSVCIAKLHAPTGFGVTQTDLNCSTCDKIHRTRTSSGRYYWHF